MHNLVFRFGDSITYLPGGMNTTTTAHGSFLRARMGSLLAVVPLGIWTV